MRFEPFAGLVFATVLGLVGCTDQNGGFLGMGSGETQGSDAGTAGGVPGYVVTGGPDNTNLGVDAGGLVGGHLAGFLEGNEKAAAGEAAARAAEVPTGQKVTWQKAEVTSQTAASGWASPSGTSFQDSGGRTCRFVHEQATRGDQMTEDTVKLCSGPTGWVPA